MAQSFLMFSPIFFHRTPPFFLNAKKLIFLSALWSSSLFGFHAGVGFAWTSINETFASELFSSENRSGKDQYEVSGNRLAPVLTVGQQFLFCNNWSWGLFGEWKYLRFRTPNMGSSVGQILPNATFSSINFFGDDTHRDFTSKTRLNHELILMATLGRRVCDGIVYLGIGPTFLNASNSIYVTAVHTPNGTGDHLVSTSVIDHRYLWGGAFRAGYQYHLSHCTFVNLAYTYLKTGSYRFKNTVNAAILNGSSLPGPVTLFLQRSVEFAIQEFSLSVQYSF